MSDPRPLVQIACVCERVLVEPDNVPSLIRVVDTYTLYTPEVPLPPEVPLGVDLTAFVSVKSGDVSGEHEIGLSLRNPGGERRAIKTWPIVLNGGEHGANLRIHLTLGKPKAGLYWLDVLWKDDVLTSIPFRIKHEHQSAQQDESTEQTTATH